MSNFIKAEMTSNNAIRCTGGFEVFGIPVYNLSFKIDTGCGYSSISLKKTNIPKNILDEHRIKDYSDKSVIKTQSFGVNDTEDKRKKERELFRFGMYENLTSVGVIKELKHFRIDSCDIGDVELKVSYTRDSNILIGMDILSKMDCHLARDNDGKVYFIACPLQLIKQGKADNYLIELERLYNLGTEISAASVRNI